MARPLTNGWENFHRLIRPDFVGGLNKAFEDGSFVGDFEYTWQV
jgi:hypothetical protein